MAMLDDPAARAALQYALAAVGAARTGMSEPLEPYDGPEPEMIPWAIAEVAAIFAEELERAGGDPQAVTGRIYLAVAGGHTEGAGHG